MRELEKKLVNANVNAMKARDENEKLVQKMAEMKNRYNEIIGSKGQLQEELIAAEEEKLKLSRALIELQIENTKLNEKLENQTYDVSTQLMHA
jgi:coiled-coil domain-containing protein 78